MPEIMGGGVALADVDGDGDLDLYLVQSGSLYSGRRSEPRRPAPPGSIATDKGTFAPAADGHGADDRGYGLGVTAGDYDNDGDTDLYVTNYGPNVLLRNDGDGRFKDVTARAGVGDPGFSKAAAFADVDADGGPRPVCRQLPVLEPGGREGLFHCRRVDVLPTNELHRTDAGSSLPQRRRRHVHGRHRKGGIECFPSGPVSALPVTTLTATDASTCSWRTT